MLFVSRFLKETPMSPMSPQEVQAPPEREGPEPPEHVDDDRSGILVNIDLREKKKSDFGNNDVCTVQVGDGNTVW